MATEQENVLFTGNIDLGVSKLAAIGAEKAVALKHEYVLPEHLVVEFVEHLLLIYPELREYVDLKSLKTQTKEYLNSLEKVKKIANKDVVDWNGRRIGRKWQCNRFLSCSLSQLHVAERLLCFVLFRPIVKYLSPRFL